MQFICPHCKILLDANVALAGQVCRCKNCGGDVVVPSPVPTSGSSTAGGAEEMSVSAGEGSTKLLKPDDIVNKTKVYDEKYPNIGQAVWLVLWYFGMSIMAAIPVFIILYKTKYWDYAILVSIPIDIVAIYIIIKYVARKTGIGTSKIVALGSSNLPIIIAGFIAICGFDLLYLAVTMAIQNISPTAMVFINKMSPDFNSTFNKAFPWNIINILLVGPIVEEILNRGVLLRGFLQHYTIRKAVIASALFFSIPHLYPIQILMAFFVGIILSLIYTKTQSLKSCFISHSLYNLLSVLYVAWCLLAGIDLSNDSVNSTYSWILIVALGIAGLIALYLGIKLFIKEYRRPA